MFVRSSCAGVDLDSQGGSVQLVHTAAPSGVGLKELEEALLLQVFPRIPASSPPPSPLPFVPLRLPPPQASATWSSKWHSFTRRSSTLAAKGPPASPPPRSPAHPPARPLHLDKHVNCYLSWPHWLVPDAHLDTCRLLMLPPVVWTSHGSCALWHRMSSKC